MRHSSDSQTRFQLLYITGLRRLRCVRHPVDTISEPAITPSGRSHASGPRPNSHRSRGAPPAFLQVGPLGRAAKHSPVTSLLTIAATSFTTMVALLAPIPWQFTPSPTPPGPSGFTAKLPSSWMPIINLLNLPKPVAASTTTERYISSTSQPLLPSQIRPEAGPTQPLTELPHPLRLKPRAVSRLYACVSTVPRQVRLPRHPWIQMDSLGSSSHHGRPRSTHPKGFVRSPGQAVFLRVL